MYSFALPFWVSLDESPGAESLGLNQLHSGSQFPQRNFYSSHSDNLPGTGCIFQIEALTRKKTCNNIFCPATSS